MTEKKYFLKEMYVYDKQIFPTKFYLEYEFQMYFFLGKFS